MYAIVTKRNTYSYSDHLHLRKHEIRCPYCRQIQENLLLLPDIEPTRARGVNYPPSLLWAKTLALMFLKVEKTRVPCVEEMLP